MTIENMDSTIINFLDDLFKSRKHKDLYNVTYRINYSKKSHSFYLKFSLVSLNTLYSKEIRISDHENSYYKKTLDNTEIIINKQKRISKKRINKIKLRIKRELEAFIRNCRQLAITSFIF